MIIAAIIIFFKPMISVLENIENGRVRHCIFMSLPLISQEITQWFRGAIPQLDSRSSVHILLQGWAELQSLRLCVFICVSQPHGKHFYHCCCHFRLNASVGVGGVWRERQGESVQALPNKAMGPRQWQPFQHYKYAVLLPVRVWCLELRTSDCTSPALRRFSSPRRPVTMPRVDADLKLDFKDVLFRPKRSSLKSRSEVRTSCSLSLLKETCHCPCLVIPE